MMQLPSLTSPSIEIAGSELRFPVRRIFCVGLNYADHALEMGTDSDRNPPFFFMKPADAATATGTSLAFPSRTSNLHHEVELVLALGAGGSNIAAAAALGSIYGWGVGLDMTRRDLQKEAKLLGRPWDMAKGFDASAPIGPLVLGTPPAVASIQLFINGQLRQNGNLAAMIWSCAEIIEALSTYVCLSAGDLIFTGTPAGVGQVNPGDRLTGLIAGAKPVEVSFES